MNECTFALGTQRNVADFVELTVQIRRVSPLGGFENIRSSTSARSSDGSTRILIMARPLQLFKIAFRL